MDELIKSINQYSNGQRIIVKFKNKLELLASIDTIYETNNELEMGDENYEEFFACLIQVLKIINFLVDDTFVPIQDDFIEITMKKEVEKITLENGIILWGKDDV